MFSPLTALSYARSISRPRRVGSGEDRLVAEEITNELERFGCRVERQPFQFSTAFDVLLSAVIALGIALIGLGLCNRSDPWWSLATSLLLFALFVLFGPLSSAVQSASVAALDGETSRFSQVCLKLGRHYETENLVASWPGATDKVDRPRLVLVAHYDSKSQAFPLAVRIGLFVAFIASGLIFAVLNLAQLALPAITPWLIPFGALAMLAGIPLLFLREGNDSPGAIDNASGAGLVLHLAGWLSEQADLLARLKVTILIPSAEEFAVLGSTAYVRFREQELRREAAEGGLAILNFDGIGVDGRLYLVETGRPRGAGRGEIAGLVATACRDFGLPLGSFKLPGALFDHIPFAQRGFDAVTLAVIGRASWWVHTPRDSADRLDERGFDGAGRVTINVIRRLAGSASGQVEEQPAIEAASER
ncbi:MAG: M28 family metallopeptidase [Rudaea sp.]